MHHQQPCQRAAGFAARFWRLALDGLLCTARQRVDHVLAVLLEQQQHLGGVALHDAGAVARRIIEVAFVRRIGCLLERCLGVGA